MVDVKEIIIKLLGEFLATTIYISIGCLGCTSSGGLTSGGGLSEALTFGLGVLVAMACFYKISGAYVNPCVSLTAAVMEREKWEDFGILVAAELLGTFAGYGLTLAFHANNSLCGWTVPSHVRTYEVRAWFLEVWLTFCWVTAACAYWEEDNMETGPIRIGLAVAGLALAGVGITGAHMNPFRTVAIAICHNYYGSCWPHIAGSIVGAACACVLWKFLFSKGPPKPVE